MEGAVHPSLYLAIDAHPAKPDSNVSGQRSQPPSPGGGARNACGQAAYFAVRHTPLNSQSL